MRSKFIASGNVQGVGFREFCRRIGESCSLCGYAKNLDDGSVEIVAEGAEEKIAEFCRRITIRSPIGIFVKKLETISQETVKEKSFAAFSVA